MRGILAAIAITFSAGCILKTDIIGAAFNGGALDSAGDPFRRPEDLANSRVERIVEEELADGFFRQGTNGDAGRWFDAASATANTPNGFCEIVKDITAPLKAKPDQPRDASQSARAESAKRRSDEIVALWTKKKDGTPGDPICTDQTPNWDALEVFLDQVRFKEGIWRAASRIAALKVEGLAEDDAIRVGSGTAFARLAKYMNNRRWNRRRNLPTNGIAIKGGAASGIFSAGAVWLVLHLVDGYLKDRCPQNDDACVRAHDIRFNLISGTSTGAMIAVGVDRFNSMKSHDGRVHEMKNLAKWFTCFSFADLMCAQSTGIQHLLDNGSETLPGVLHFDGIEKVLSSCVHDSWVFDNASELILNTTEFRTGRLFALSDQNELATPSDVVHASLASALLPVIGDPDKHAWSGSPFDVKYDPHQPDRTQPAYLDGGIRSELPILPLVRRGADRILAVASGASMITEVKRLANALDIGVQYINVNTGAVTETELEYARRLAESMRQSEIASCMSALADVPNVNRFNICHGDFDNACTFVDEAAFKEKRKLEDSKTPAQRLERFWKMESLFFDASCIDGLSGYDFRPSELRRLFRAGAETARVRCLDIARLIGILPDGPAPAKDLENVNTWCAARMDDNGATCNGISPKPDFAMRACKVDKDGRDVLAALPEYLDACKGEKDPW